MDTRPYFAAFGGNTSGSWNMATGDTALYFNTKGNSNTATGFQALQPAHFYWKSEEYSERQFGSGRSFGLIAQEVEKLLPELVTEDSRGYKAVRCNMLPLMLLQALKEQHEIVRRQQAENAELKARLERLERMIGSHASAVKAE